MFLCSRSLLLVLFFWCERTFQVGIRRRPCPEKLCHQSCLKTKSRNRVDDEVTQISQCVKQASQVAQPVQQAISFTVDDELVKAHVDFKASELVLPRRLFLGWEFVPGARLGQVVVVLMKSIVFRETNLKHL